MPVAPEHTLLGGLLVGALGGGGGLWAFLGSRSTGKVDLIKVATAAAKDMIDQLQEQVDRQDKRAGELAGRITQLEGEVQALKDERHGLRNEVMAERKKRREAEERADAAEARCTELRGEVRQLAQRTDSLQRQLKAAGLPIDPPGPRDGAPLALPAPTAS